MYSPPVVPTDPEQLVPFLQAQLQMIAVALADINPQSVRLQATDQDLDRPEDGDLVYFPANDFDPGSGAGLYFYSGSTWNFII